MRPRVPWMNEVDDAILEFYEELEASTDFSITLPPMTVYVNLVEELGVLDKSSNTISRRMQRLSEMELLEKSDKKRGYYRITEKGIRYLSGELDADELTRPDDS